jgi:hypothetical protein
MAGFKAFRSFQSTLTALDIKPSIRKSSFRTSSYSFLDAFKSIVQTQAKAPVIQPRQIEAQLPQLQLSQKRDKILAVQNLVQGRNECGSTSLAMIMRYYGIDPGNYHEMFPSDAVGHSPWTLKEKAEGRGLVVRQENYGDLNDLAALIDKGIPPMVLGIYGGGSNYSLSDYIDNSKRAHWMVVTGYKKDENGKITHVYFNNPNRSTPQCWTASDFLTKFWNNNILPGGHRYYMAMAKRGTYQEAALKRYLPGDKISESFRMTLQIAAGLERTAYAGERAVDEIRDAAETVADAAEDALDTISGWFS